MTGPLFLIASLATALDALAILAVDWKLIFVGTGLGTLLAYMLEWMRGKYVGTTLQ